MSLQSKQNLYEKLKSKHHRNAFVWSRITQTLAIQARVLRQRSGWSQQGLAEALETSQNAVYRMESPKYGKHSLTTLKKWAEYFDVGLVVSFAPHSEGDRNCLRSRNYSRSQCVKDSDADPAAKQHEQVFLCLNRRSARTPLMRR